MEQLIDIDKTISEYHSKRESLNFEQKIQQVKNIYTIAIKDFEQHLKLGLINGDDAKIKNFDVLPSVCKACEKDDKKMAYDIYYNIRIEELTGI